MDFFLFDAWVDVLKSRIISSQISTCHNPETESLFLSISHPDRMQRDSYLWFETSGATPGLYYFDEIPRPDKPTLLAKSFRKKIAGARITDIRIPFPDRSMVISLSLPEWSGPRELWFEMRGPRGNLICVDSESRLILECFSKIPDREKGKPRIPGQVFSPLYDDSDNTRISLMDISQVSAFINEHTLWQEILNGITPMTPYLARYLANEIQENSTIPLTEQLQDIVRIWTKKKYTPVISTALPKSMFLAFPGPTCNPQDQMSFNSVIEGARQWRTEIRIHHEFRRFHEKLSRLAQNRLSRIDRNIQALKSDLRSLPDPGILQQEADLLSANYKRITPGMSIITVEDFFDPKCAPRDIELDPTVVAKIQVERRFNKVRKIKRSRPLIEARLKNLSDEKESLESIIWSLDAASGLDDIREIRKRMEEHDIIESSTRKGRGVLGITKRSAYMKFRSSQGYTILVGKGARDNDSLSFQHSKPHDFWLHAHGYRGAHVIIQNPEKQGSIPEKTVLEAAGLAVYYSKARGEKGIPVFVTQRRNVRRAPGGVPGRAIVGRHSTVTPPFSDKRFMERLKHG